MARKDRAPLPRKRTQAPQRRFTPKPRPVLDRRRLLYALAAAVAVTGAVALGAVLVGGGETAEQKLAAAGCKLTTAPGLAGRHIPDTVEPNWNTDPPTNGDQSDTPVVYGIYDEPVSLRSIVHNLEHGGVYILYGKDVPQADVNGIRAFYDDNPDGLVVAAFPRLGKSIVLGAWPVPADGQPEFGAGRLARCRGFDSDAFSAFLDAYGFQGLERVPRDSLRPGSV